MKDETLLPDFDGWSRRCEIQLLLCNREFREVAEFTWNAACRAALQSGNSAQPVMVPDDTRRMDWLVSKTVNVREPLVYGSHDLFWSQTISDDWEEEHKTTLREQIDAAMAAAPKVTP